MCGSYAIQLAKYTVSKGIPTGCKEYLEVLLGAVARE